MQAILFIIMSILCFSRTQALIQPKRALLSHYRQRLSSVRPSLDDVERISRGQAAKKRGTGSRNVPHRLNEMERKEWDLAKKRRYLLVRGTGWRKERGDSPLLNIYRQLCDALEIPSISVQRGVQEPGESEPLDIVHIDFSPLRTLDVQEVMRSLRHEASGTYTSFISMDDNSLTAGSPLSPNEMQAAFQEDVIWRIQAFGLTVRFRSRKDARSFASYAAIKYAGGTVIARSESSPVGQDDDE